MDLISRLPKVILPYLCSFGTLEMHIAMACVNRKWRRVIHKYGDIKLRVCANWSTENIKEALNVENPINLQRRMFGALQIRISHANDCLATSRVRSNILKMNNVLQSLEVPKEMDQAYLLRSLVSCLESLEIQKVHKDLPCEVLMPIGCEGVSFCHQVEQSTLYCEIRSRGHELISKKFQLEVVLRGGFYKLYHGKAENGAKQDTRFTCAVRMGRFFSDGFFYSNSVSNEDDTAAVYNAEEDIDMITKMTQVTREEFIRSCSSRLLFYFLKCMVIAVDEEDSMEEWYPQVYRNTNIEKEIERALATLATTKQRTIYFPLRAS